MLYSTIILKQYEKTVYIRTKIYMQGAKLLPDGKIAAKIQENVGKRGFAVEFAPDSCYFSNRKRYGKAKSCAGPNECGRNDAKNQRWNVPGF